MSKLNVKSMKKSTLDHLITFAMVIVAYLIVQILIAAGVLSSLMQGLLVPMCTYSIVAIGLNLCVGYLGGTQYRTCRIYVCRCFFKCICNKTFTECDPKPDSAVYHRFKLSEPL